MAVLKDYRDLVALKLLLDGGGFHLDNEHTEKFIKELQDFKLDEAARGSVFSLKELTDFRDAMLHRLECNRRPSRRYYVGFDIAKGESFTRVVEL